MGGGSIEFKGYEIPPIVGNMSSFNFGNLFLLIFVLVIIS
jgi:hypothetical protein